MFGSAVKFGKVREVLNIDNATQTKRMLFRFEKKNQQTCVKICKFILI